MTAAIYNFVPNILNKPYIEQGADFLVPLIWKDSLGVVINLTGFTAKLQVRETYGDPSLLLEMTTENGGISIDGLNGKVTLFLTGEQTQIINWEGGVYDLLLSKTSTGKDTRLMQGTIIVSPGVTIND